MMDGCRGVIGGGGGVGGAWQRCCER